MTSNFFKELYTNDPSVEPEPLLDLVQPRVTSEMNELLCKNSLMTKFQMLCSRWVR